MKLRIVHTIYEEVDVPEGEEEEEVKENIAAIENILNLTNFIRLDTEYEKI